MFKNDLKTSVRFMKRERLYTVINLLGLSTGLAIALLMIQYVKFEFSYENYNPLASDIARITLDYMDGETVFEQDCETYPPLGPKIKNEFAEVKEFARTYHIDETVLQVSADKFFTESKMYAADHSFFEMFNHRFVHGDETTAFRDPYEAVLTESEALKFYGKVDAVGETFNLRAVDKVFQVVGIIPDPPANTHLKFNALISYPTMKAAFGEKDDNWGGNNTFTYLQLTDVDKYQQFEANLITLNETLRDEGILPNDRVIAQPIKDIHLHSHKSFEAEANGDYESVIFLLGVAILVIIIAVVNYVNLSTSKSLDRAKEVGIRKVLGSTKRQLRGQFFTESLLMNGAAAIIALALMFALLGEFRQIALLHPEFTFYDDISFWGLLGGILLFNTLVAGFLPALFLSSFQPVAALKGKYTNSQAGVSIRKGLVILQFAITTFLLVQTLAADWQLDFMRNMGLGLETERVLVTAAPEQNFTKEGYEAFKGQVLNHSLFSSVGISSCVPGMAAHQMSTTTGINPVDAMQEHNNNFYIYFIDEDFFETMGIELVAGENLVPGDIFDQVIVNEEALRIWGYPTADEAIGKRLDYWGGKPKIGGVIRNFHQFSPKEPHIPMIFMYVPDQFLFFSVKANSGTPSQQVQALERIYESTFTDNPFQSFFLDQKFDEQYRMDAQFQQVFAVLTIFAIIISCLGLFGLASFTAAKRAKEIGVRKVLGASIVQVIALISKSFLSLVSISLIISLPVTYFVIEQWLQGFASQMLLSVWLFALPSVLVLLVAGLSILSKTYAVSIANPIKALRDE